jgi:RHS repeat-associated protein
MPELTRSTLIRDLAEVTSGDGAGSTDTLFELDTPDRALYSWVYPSYGETDFGWDAEGNLNAVYNGSFTGVQTYTPVNLLETFRPSAAASPQTTTTFSYNKDRSLEFIRQPGGLGIDYVYDTGTRQLVSIVADGVKDATFGYYDSSTCSGCANGQLETATRGVTTVTLGYNGPLMTSEAWSGAGDDAVNGSVSWGYNADLRATSETVTPAPAPSGLGIVSYGYDPDGMATCASLSTCDTGAPNKLSLTYDATSGALTDTSIGNAAEHFTPNEYGELASYSAKYGGASLLSIVYDDGSAHPRDGLGRVRRESDVADSTSYSDYEYDDHGRLWRVSLNGSLINQYGYDDRGNRTSVDPSGAVIASYDLQDVLLNYAGTTYSYWPNGERRTRVRPDQTVDQYQYDTLGNLSEVATPYATVDYVVDALNRRIVKKKNGTPYARYLYGSGSAIAAVLDSSGNLAARFVYASHPNTPDFMVLADGSVYRFLCDQLGSPRLIVNSTSGAIAQKISYDAFGTATVQTSGPFPAWQQPFGFAGGLYDEDTGLVRFGARDYDPEVGRWLARDPILFKGGQANLYVYAGNDPVNRIDPSGRFWWIVAGAAAGAAADAALQLYGNGGDFGKLDLGEIGTAAAVGALLPGLGAEIILGTAFSGVSTSGGLVAVTQWGGQASPWVMLGANTFRNYWLSGSPELGYARDDAQTLYVESSELSYPGGWQWIKGTWGQRICQ